MNILSIKQLLRNDLKAVEDQINKTLTTSIASEAQTIISHILSSQGKLIRPILVLLSAYAIHPNPSRTEHHNLILAASAIELIHIASLIHDDVIDNADQRRGKKSIKGKFGNTAAVTSGVLLYSIALQLLTQTESLDLLNDISQTVQSMCEGEILQEYNRKNKFYDKNSYYKILKSKTGILFRSATLAGTHMFKEKKKFQKHLEIFAVELGYAFQLSDDYLDLYGNTQDLNKQTGQDKLQGTITMPAILAVKNETSKNKVKKELQDIIKTHIETGTNEIRILEKSKYSEALIYLAEYILKRCN